MQHNKENKMVEIDIKSGMNSAGGVMQVRENLTRLFLCAVKKGYAIKKVDKTPDYSHSFTSQAEQFYRTRRSQNHNRIFVDVETEMFWIRKALPKNHRRIVCL